MKILLDFDSTLVNTPKAYFDYYREVTKDYSTTYSEDLVSWNMQNLCPLWNTLEHSEDVFIQEGFFKYLELFPNVIDILNKLKEEGHYLHIVSCHNIKGAEFKIDWIRKNLPMINKVTIIPIKNGLQRFDKSCVEADLLLDDKVDALKSARTKHKVLYGYYDWNKHCTKYPRITSWNKFYELINNLGV